MASITARQRSRQTLISIWQRFAILVLVVTAVVLGGIGVGVYALVHGFGPSVGVWLQLQKTGAPPFEENGLAAYAYDKAMGRLLLFGGWGHFERAEGGPLGDTWSFDSSTSTWTELKPAKSPPFRGWATMAYDEDAGRMILFGGGASKSLADTWSYDSAKNTWTKLRTAGSPGPRGGASMFYDPTLRRLVMTGGQNSMPTTPMAPDCWAFSY
jgi:hypothetical protein